MIAFATALALAVVIEGVLLALFTRPMQKLMAETALLPGHVVRWVGVIATGLGVAAIWLIRR
ncbi:MAG: DUF2065 domain-containing protein [Alphaproteobacteria bacterium]|jgi:uncharacterized protein|nr:DUF2065 domain-containing protein [Alphaproteobacteria bacterium]